MTLNVLRRQRQHCCTEISQLTKTIVVRIELLGAYRRCITGIKHEHYRTARKVRQRIRTTTRALSAKQRSRITYSGCSHYVDADSNRSSVASKFAHTACTSSESSKCS